MKPKKCAGVQVSGYWRGWPCGATPTATYNGKRYCAPHHSIAMTRPEKFDAARKAHERAERRRAAEQAKLDAKIETALKNSLACRLPIGLNEKCVKPKGHSGLCSG